MFNGGKTDIQTWHFLNCQLICGEFVCIILMLHETGVKSLVIVKTRLYFAVSLFFSSKIFSFAPRNLKDN